MMLRLLDDWRWPAWRPRPKTVQQGLEIALVLILAWQAARLIWLFAAPIGPLGMATTPAFRGAPRVDLAVLERFDPFFRNQPASGPSAGGDAADGGVTLFGVRTDGRGGGSAIIGTPDGRQASYVVGDDLGGGMALRAIGVDHVVLTRAGARIRLEFAERGGSSTPVQGAGAVLAPATPSATPAPALSMGPGLDPKQFLSAAALTPQMKDGRIAGYRVMARGRGETLRQAGLQDGDVLLAVDGSPLSPERISELPDLLAAASEVEVRFERNGQPMTTRLRTVSR